jgi:peptidoglycan hydrolase-like protein with peptidoglycan-binding domain
MESSPKMRALPPLSHPKLLGLSQSLASLILGSMLLGTPAQAQSVLTQGSEGDEVNTLQRRLTDLGCLTNNGPIDGIFGDQTQTAVETFQRVNGMTVDGVVGGDTNQRLFDINTLPCRSLGAIAPAVPTAAPIAANSDLIRRTQSDLKVAGYYAGDVDGVWGPETELAVTTFQNVQALPATGQIDNATLGRLDQIYNRPAQSSIQPSVQTVQPWSQPGVPQVGATTQTTTQAPPASTPLVTYGQPNPIGNAPVYNTPVYNTPVYNAPIGTPVYNTPTIPTAPVYTPTVSVPSLPNSNLPNSNLPIPNIPSPTNPSNWTNGSVTRPLPQTAPQAPKGRDRLSTPDQGYAVAIPAQTDVSLSSLQRLFPRAGLRTSKRGPYIFVEAYEQRDAADAIAKALVEQGIDARVVYRPE